MLQALAFGAVASLGLVLGSAIGAFWTPPRPLLAALLAFASGSLLAAMAFELFGAAEREAGLLVASVALTLGAATFIGADWLLERYVHGSKATGLALAAAVTLDGIPENLALGVTLLEGGSFVLLIAIFASNFGESLDGAVKIREGEDGSARLALAVWLTAAVVLAVSVVAGRAALGFASDAMLAALLAFAGGAVLAALADTLMPEAYRAGGPRVAFATTAGFVLSYALAS